MKTRRRPFYFIVSFLVISIATLLILEITGRLYFFQKQAPQPSAIALYISLAREKLLPLRARYLWQKQKVSIPLDSLYQRFYTDTSETAQALRQLFFNRYEQHFSVLSAICKSRGIPLFVIYIPMDQRYSKHAQNMCRAFFSNLSVREKVPFWDAGVLLCRYSEDDVFLLPVNGHLTRWGNHRIADFLRDTLEEVGLVMKNQNFSIDNDTRLGDLTPGDTGIWPFLYEIPFRNTVNRQGLRMQKDVTSEKQKIRILFLGDSFTFGAYGSTRDAFPNRLEAIAPQYECLNAGVMGYSIQDELGLFKERAIKSRPDAVILQVLDNDIFGQFYFERNIYGRDRKNYSPHVLETAFIKSIGNP
jgi:hypothetical protein